MPLATASSAYLLEDRASATLRGIRGEAERTTRAANDTSKALDRLGDAKMMARLQGLDRRLGDVATTSERMSRRVQTAVGHMEGAIRRDTLKAEVRLTELMGRMDELGRKRAAPRVDLDGFAQTRIQIAELNRALDALGRRTATMRVGAVGGAGGGGGGRSGAFVGPGGLGAFSTRGGVLAGAAVTALPVVSALTGTVLPLAGSLTGASLGAGGVGLAGGGALVAGIGALTSVVKPAAAGVKDLRKEQERYNEVVAQYGAASTQALEAQRQLDAAIKKAPEGARNLSRELDMLSHKWRDLTAPGQRDILGLGAGAAQRVRAVSPFLAAQSNKVAAATRTEGLNLTDWATSPAGLIIVRDLTNAFADNLDEAEGTLENVLGTLGNLARASIPDFHEGTVFLEHWTGGWETSTRDIGETRRQIGGYLDDLKAWGRLGGAGFDLIKDLIMPGRQQGTSVVENLTAQLEEWDRWVERNPEKIRRFYDESIDATKELAGLIGTVVSDLHDLAQILVPILSRFAQLGQLAGGAGLLLPAALRYGLGRSMGRGASGRSGAAASASAAAVAGAAAGAAAGRPGRSALGVALNPRAAATKFGGSALRVAGPIAGVSAALGASSTQGDFGERLQGALSGLTFGIVPGVSTTAQRREVGDAQALEQIQRLNAPRGEDDYRRQITNLERKRTAHAQLAGIGFDTDDGLDARSNTAAVKKYTEAIRDLRREREAYRREANRRSGVASEIHGEQLAGSLQTGFSTLSNARGPEAALRDTIEGTLTRMRRMRPEGARVLGESMLTWAQTVAKGSPKLQAIVDDMTSSIEHRFSRMGQRVEVVNGRILSGSRSEWLSISKALSDPAEDARQKVTAAFTAIQREAIGSLRAMGYSSGEATALVKARERGGLKAEQNTLTGISASHGDTASSRARAGGTGDGIGDGPGTVAAMRRSAAASRGGLMGADPALSGYASDGAKFGLHVTSGARPGSITKSGNLSLHASGHAIDEAGTAEGMLRYARYMAQRYGSGLDELIHTPLGYGIKNGRRVPLSFWGPTINADHNDHVHVGDRTPGGTGGGALGAFAGGGGGMVLRLNAKKSGLAGVPGALADRAAEMYAAGLENKVNDAMGGGSIAGLGAGGGGATANRALALRMLLSYKGGKWGRDQWPPLNSLWTRESNFDENAINPQSGAGGIPQALPPSKMGPGWQGNPRHQIGWGLGYIDERYGSPTGAWGHSQQVGWYGRGGTGTARKPTIIGIGDHPTRAEDFSVTPRKLGPPSSRAGRGAGARGFGSVTIKAVHVNWHREGDLQAAIEDEVGKAFAKLAVELDDGVDLDEDALIR